MSATCWIWLHGWCKNLASQRGPREYVRRHLPPFSNNEGACHEPLHAGGDDPRPDRGIYRDRHAGDDGRIPRHHGDVSPIHIDADYARGRGFPGRVVYGMLGASFFSTLAGVYLPGEHCLLHGVECKFAKPIFIGDTLTVKGTVVGVSEIGSEAEIKAVITNQDGKRVTRGIIKAGLAK